MEEFLKEHYGFNTKKKKKKAKFLPDVVKSIRNFTPDKIDYANQKVISYSQLSIFNQCKHRWKLQYVDKHKPFTSSIHTIFGTSLHHAIQLYLTEMYDKSGPKADELDIIDIFESKLREEYKEQYKKNNNQHFSSSEELAEFFEDGVEILNYFKKNKAKYFGKRQWYLVGCEIPILIAPNPKRPDILFQGFIDVVLYNELTETFTIIDIKTSTRGWGDKEKKDKTKQHQLVLYKRFFSEQFGVNIDMIEVEFFILKRKLIESPDFIIKRIQRFIPPSAKTSINQASNSMNEFINSAFIKKEELHPNPSKYSCMWCPFLNKQCKSGIN